MAITRNLRTPTKETYRTSKSNRHHHLQLDPKKLDHQKPPPQQQQQMPPPQPPSWAVMKSILSCKHLQVNQQQQHNTPQNHQKQKQQKLKQKQEESPGGTEESLPKKSKKMRCSGSLCSNTKAMVHRPTATMDASLPPPATSSLPNPVIPSRRIYKPSSSSFSYSSSNGINDGSSRSISVGGAAAAGISSSSTSSSSHSVSNLAGANIGSLKGMPFRRLSGCYECRMVVDPVLGYTKNTSLRATACSCTDCGEIFLRAEYLELHQSVSHAVSELGPEDTSKNIVEIIFQSSWLRKQAPICKIDRILKIHNTPTTVTNFEHYRDAIKSKANKLPKKDSRCIADGNELLRFHCTTFICSLGLNGSSNLCNRIPDCGVCSVIRDGFRLPSGPAGGILTTATSGRAHDRAEETGRVLGDGKWPDGPKRAMLVCRVIAGRVMRSCVDVGSGAPAEYDSVAAAGAAYSGLDELYVFNPKAILPCFVVVYRGV